MSMNYSNIDPRTRELMLEEIDHDVANGCLYIGARLTPAGEHAWESLLREAVRSGSDETLAAALQRRGYLQSHEVRHTRNGASLARVPHNAADLLAEGEFNRFYCRAVCRRAMDVDDEGLVQVCRAKVVSRPRPESERKLGLLVSAERLLADLRAHPGVDTALGIPAGPGSGLSVALRAA